MIGFLVGLVTRFMWLGYLVIEAFIFKVAFNLWVPYFNSLNLMEYTVPEFHLSFLGSFGLFVLIHYIGKFIKSLVPTLVSVSSDSESTSEK